MMAPHLGVLMCVFACSDVRGAGTDADVSIELHGEKVSASLGQWARASRFMYSAVTPQRWSSLQQQPVREAPG
jgi:hypothetical protein